MRTFTPAFSTYRKQVAGSIPAVIVIGVVGFLRIRQPLPVYAAEWLGIVILAYGYLALYFRNTRIKAEPHSLSIHNAFGSHRSIAQQHLAQAVLVRSFAQASGMTAIARARLLILDDTGRVVLRWSGQTWTEDQMRSLADSLAIPLRVIDGPTNAKALRAAYPRAVTVVEAHPTAIGLGIFAVVFVAVIVAVFST
ncbi:MAG: hypothetical protein JWQ39_996 [Glaciihabitans sp.]|jgi:hypothetical protein|nr:hypothetical protein [Glaciihabitans sp.]